MSTGLVESWAGNIADIGPIYPFVGTETILVIVAVAYWIYWHIKQARDEDREIKDDQEKLKNKAKLEKYHDD